MNPILCGVLTLFVLADAPAPLYQQDFEQLSVGPLASPPASLLKDNTWTGNQTTFGIVETNDVAGQALEISVDSFAQVVLGRPVKVESGQTYRIRGTVASAGQKKFSLLLRRGPAPYTSYVTVDDTANEIWRKFDYLVTSRGSDDGALVMLVIHGDGPFLLGDLTIEPSDAKPEVMPPPRLGNLVQNSSFELGWDGWLCRDESGWTSHHTPGSAEIDETIAAFGRRSVRMTGDALVSCPFAPIAYGQTYSISAMARADYPEAKVGLMVSGSNHKRATLAVPNGTWRRISWTHKFESPRGTVQPHPYADVWLSSETPAGKHVWLDDLVLQYGPAPDYQPAAPVETALSTTVPGTVVSAGQPLGCEVTTAIWQNGGQPPTAYTVQDEQGTVVQRGEVNLAATGEAGSFAAYRGRFELRLPPGHYRVATDGPTESAGELLATVVPTLPAETTFDWQAGTHPSFGLPLASCGLRWARLHDVSKATKWPAVEPAKGRFDWTAADAAVDNYRTEGYRVLGLLDSVPAWRMGTAQPSRSAMKYPDADFADWERYVYETVKHLRGRVDAWEVMNEPVYAGKGPTGETNAAWYVSMLKVAYQAAKRAAPEVLVIGGGGAPLPAIDHAWTVQAIDAGIFRYCDAFSFHGYGKATTQVFGGPRPLVDYMTWLHAAMQQQLGRTLPVWDSEVGVGAATSSRKFWVPNRGPLDAEDTARAAVICLLAERAAGVAKTFFYAAFATRLYEPLDLYMFTDVNQQLTPVAQAVAVATSQLEGLAPQGFEQPEAGTTVLQFANESRTVYAAWTLRGESTVTLTVPPGATARGIGFHGRELPLQQRGEQVIVPIGPRPVYVAWRR